MSDPSDLLQTLLITSARLVAIRKSIADGGHIQAMVDIDTLVAVAKQEADRGIAIADSPQLAAASQLPLARAIPAY